MLMLSLISGCVSLPPKTPLQIIENSLGMKFVRVPAGEFVMGRSESTDSLALD